MTTALRHPRRLAGIYLALAVAILIVGGLAGWGLAGLRAQERDDTQAAARPLAEQLLELCERNTARARDLAQIGLCERARDTSDTITDTGPVLIEGPPGPRGLTGPRGYPGLDGADGTDGRDGNPGGIGPRGAPGATGLSCTAEIGIDDCRGPAGPQGPQGPAGAAGPQGPAGPSGTARPGTYRCADGEYVRGFTIGEGGAVTLDCAALPVGPAVLLHR